MEDLEDYIVKAQKGDTQAFGQIYQLFYKRIYRFCRIHVADEQIAADVCQETFIKAWKAIPNFSMKKGGSFQAFLFRIARNLLIDLSRKKKESSIEEISEVESKEDITEYIDKESEAKKLHEALNELASIDREIIILRYFEDLSFTEVAKVVHMNEGALRVKIHRALKKIKKLLGE